MTEQPEDILDEYTRACIAVAQLLRSNPVLTETQRLALENSLAIIQVNYNCRHRSTQSTGRANEL